MLNPYAVSPLATGGVELEWRAGRRLIRIDVGPEAELDYLVRRDRDGQREYTEQHDCSLDQTLIALNEVLRA